MAKFGHEKMVVWGNIERMNFLVQKEIIKKIPKNSFYLRDQIDRSCSSVGANFIEGYYSGSIKEYLRFLHYSRRSLAELQNWVKQCYLKECISQSICERFNDISIKTFYLFNRLIYSLKNKCRPKP